MEYLANFEIRAMEKGIAQGILQKAREDVLQVLNIKFHTTSPELTDAIGKIEDPGTLNGLLVKAVTTASLDEFQQALSS